MTNGSLPFLFYVNGKTQFLCYSSLICGGMVIILLISSMIRVGINGFATIPATPNKASSAASSSVTKPEMTMVGILRCLRRITFSKKKFFIEWCFVHCVNAVLIFEIALKISSMSSCGASSTF